MSQIAESDLFGRIAALLTTARHSVRQAVNSTMVQTYWGIGQIIVEDEQQGQSRAAYGEAVLKELGLRLTAEFGKGFDERNLRYMRQFYLFFPIWNALSSELSWTHYRHLLRVENEPARLWYMREAVSENWTTRALERQINSFYYERLLSSQNKAPVIAEAAEKTKKLMPQDILKDPYVLEFLELKSRPAYTEDELESALINELQNFLLELGAGFSFVARQKHFDLDSEHFYASVVGDARSLTNEDSIAIDLVFYNFKLKCFVLIDLKRGKLTHQDVGQMDTYIRIYEDKLRGEDDNPTIGLILCADKNEAIAKYSVLADGEQIFAAKYQLVLPKVEELEAELLKEVSLLKKEFLP